ncbi:MAG TPA: TonB-dependent receptor [Vicinamibacterales bacterium]|nr:TonB-dependent receptor [Vicinamibacterales bacterium]
MRRKFAVFIFVLAVAAPSWAQTLFQGRIDVTVLDGQGRAVPGALVEIGGPTPMSQTTDDSGEAHFLNLSPGAYSVTAALSGFSTYRNDKIEVAGGRSVPLKVTLGVSGVAEAVQVTAEPLVVDPGRQTITTTVSYDQLQRLPSSRDPWVVLQTVPGVVVDRVNVGGAESGQQSNVLAKGAGVTENTWNLDGIPVTDLASTGSSPTYYNFDMFQEMSVTTGGASATSPTAGAQLNMQFKTGANRASGAAHYYGAGESLQASNLPDELLPLAGPSGKGNRIKELSDIGFDVGGPIVRDRWWAWGSYGRTDGTLFTLNGDPDKTKLENIAFKTSAQVTNAIRPEFLFFRGNKVKNGRGASPLRAPETTWDQTGPTPLYKGQVNISARNDMFLTVRAGHVGNGFSLTPQGGMGTTGYRDAGRVRHGSYVFYETKRPDNSFLADGNWFRGRHELVFGGSWRHTRDDERQEFPGSGADNLQATDFATSRRLTAYLYRPFFASSVGVNQSLYAGDTIHAGRVTAQFSLRFDRSYASMLESRQEAIPGFPALLPAIVAPAEDKMIDISLLSPRAGLSYALDEQGHTILRASYGLFGSQLGTGTVQAFSAASQALLIYSATDRNGNNVADPNELETLQNFAGVDPAHPAAGVNFNRIDPDFKAPKTHEVVVGIDREVMANFGVSASVSWRRFTDIFWSGYDPSQQITVYPLVGVTRADYVLEGTASGNVSGLGAYHQDYFAPRESSLPAGNGSEFRNRPDYYQQYLGLEVQATKRLSDRWMARVGFSSNRHTEHFTGTGGIQDPGASTTWPNIDGGAFVTGTSGSGKSEIYLILPRYQLSASGMYQMPYGINVAGTLLAREGYGMPFFETVESADPLLPEKRVLLVDPRDSRLPGVTTLDLRGEKVFTFGGRELALSLDLFNALNSATVLGRQYDVTTTGNTGYNQPLEIMNPRLVRFGVRFQF